jgi:hypothetical protein
MGVRRSVEGARCGTWMVINSGRRSLPEASVDDNIVALVIQARIT